MTEEVRKWVDALRSKQYKQCMGYLNNKEGYCCLGVACEIFKEELDLEVGELENCMSYDGFTTCLPDKVIKHLNLSSACGDYKVGALITKNDTGKSFEEIADLIEGEPDGLFTKKTVG